MIPTRNEMLNAGEKVSKYLHRTPILSSSGLNKITGCQVFFKCENFQKTGSYKSRGATNAILNLSDKQKEKGVITHSSGNFAQAIALSAKNLGIEATIVMPENAPRVKKDAVLGYGARVIVCESTLAAREATVEKEIKKSGASFIHPSNDLMVIQGQGTAFMELNEEIENLDAVFAPIGGGGLIAGTATSVHYFSPKTEVYGAEPSGADDAWQSFHAGRIIPQTNPQTIADGLRTSLGNFNFPIIQQLVKDIILVEEEEIILAMKLIYERMKIVIEPSSAVAFAALIKEREKFKNKKLGIIISGGNVDLKALAPLL
ncbi:threonine/serine dehydratase [bacterium]|nr:threonine/serine dehydratase [bacterium]